ncbi:hypothetical protein WA026_012739 [Henosepilachna vigintioctopunctata]|uniref:Uncharacterized protein n=1 Tax=Henosepilachna vigintioctopunctata TaxID=420089 RepID=A0AAW1U721_9CUCU
MLDYYYVASTTNPEHKDTYKKIKQYYDSALSNAKKEFHDELILASNNKSKMVWQIINSITGRKTKSNNLPDLKGFPAALANRFNTFFSEPSEITAGCPKMPNTYFSEARRIPNSFFIFDITPSEYGCRPKCQKQRAVIFYFFNENYKIEQKKLRIINLLVTRFRFADINKVHLDAMLETSKRNNI